MKIFFLKNLKQWFGYFKKISVPDVLKENDSSVELPNENPIFCNLTKSQMSELVPFLKKVTANPGQILVKEGELNDEMFILEEGEVEVLKGETNQLLGCLKTGDCFGEMALLEHVPRSATIRATKASKFLVLSSAALDEIASREKIIFSTLMKNIATHLSKTVRDTSNLTIATLKKELEITKRYTAMSRFLISLLIFLAIYNLSLGITMQLVTLVVTASIVNIPLIIFFAIGSFYTMRFSGYPLSFYGLTFKGGWSSLKESFFWSLVVMFGLTLLRWIAIKTIPHLHHLNLFAMESTLSDEKMSDTSMIAFVIAYVFVSPIQEFIFRGAIQSTLQELLVVRHKMLWAVLITSLLFTVGHLQIGLWILPMVFVPSLLWGWLYSRQGTLLGVSVSHIILGLWAFYIIDLPGLLQTFFAAF